jgi:hypothetical protein
MPYHQKIAWETGEEKRGGDVALTSRSILTTLIHTHTQTHNVDTTILKYDTHARTLFLCLSLSDIQTHSIEGGGFQTPPLFLGLLPFLSLSLFLLLLFPLLQTPTY